MKHTIFSDIKNAILDSEYAKEYLTSIKKHFKDWGLKDFAIRIIKQWKTFCSFV